MKRHLRFSHPEIYKHVELIDQRSLLFRQPLNNEVTEEIVAFKTDKSNNDDFIEFEDIFSENTTADSLDAPCDTNDVSGKEVEEINYNDEQLLSIENREKIGRLLKETGLIV